MSEFARSLTLLTLSALLFPPASARADDWSRFRGPNGSGVVECEELPVEFGPERNVRWKIEIAFGRSSPVLTQDSLFLTASTEKELSILCIDSATGELRWKRSLERAHVADRYNGTDSAVATPVTDGENVYVFFQELGLVSFDADGKQRWLFPLGPFNSYYGVAASPILAGDTLLLPCDTQSGGFLLAVGKDDGQERWRADRSEFRDSWATPVLYPSVEEPTEVILFGDRNLRGYRVDTGEETWCVKGVGAGPVSSPVLYEELLFICTPHHAEQPMPSFDVILLGVDKDGDGKISEEEAKATQLADHFGWFDAANDGSIDREEWDSVVAAMSTRNYGLIAFDLGTLNEDQPPTELWRHKRNLPQITTPLFYEGVLYLATKGGILTSLDPVTGDVHHRARLGEGLGECFPSPIAGDGKVYIAGNDGQVAVLEAGAVWKVLAVNDLAEEINATPAIGGDGALFVRTKSMLYCFGRE
jgi:outer membrane protein assembly factor BamB